MKIYNTLHQQKELLKPIEEKHVKIYACGVTTYDDCHIGHAMQAVFFDMMRSYLEYVGYKVTYVRNYTDVDDKIIDRAKSLNMSPRQLAEEMIQSSKNDMEKLELRPATFEPKVSECIPDIISMIETLIENKTAYKTTEGDVYYRVRQKSDYGKLSNRKVDELLSGTRHLSQGSKEDPMDFALWKKDTTQDASWTSPWGTGRPGWHIECSVMSKKYLGACFDIHGGGRDLIFPHHENEIAQSESANKCSYASIWVHSGLLTINKQKMSKSLGNHIRIKDFLKKWDAEVLRFSYLQNHYSSNIDFSEKVFQNSRRRLFYYYQTLKLIEDLSKDKPGEAEKVVSHDVKNFEDKFSQSMNDDFNTPKAIAEMNIIIKKANKYLNSNPNKKIDELIKIAQVVVKVCSVFGLLQKDPSSFLNKNNQILLNELNLSEETIQEEIKKRQEARDEKNWAVSDKIRENLFEKGIMLQDSGEKTTWILKDVLD